MDEGIFDDFQKIEKVVEFQQQADRDYVLSMAHSPCPLATELIRNVEIIESFLTIVF